MFGDGGICDADLLHHNCRFTSHSANVAYGSLDLAQLRQDATSVDADPVQCRLRREGIDYQSPQILPHGTDLRIHGLHRSHERLKICDAKIGGEGRYFDFRSASSIACCSSSGRSVPSSAIHSLNSAEPIRWSNSATVHPTFSATRKYQRRSGFPRSFPPPSPCTGRVRRGARSRRRPPRSCPHRVS